MASNADDRNGKISSGAFASAPIVKTPVTVLTGFLGSGKTTLLQRTLASPGMADTAVIINEAGEMGLDHLLVEAVDEQVFELPSGCLCCVRRLDIATTLRRLIERRGRGEIPAFRRIVIETSGLADPSPILYTLAADPMLGHELALCSVVTLVDAVAGQNTLNRHPEAMSQAAVADRILITKTDIAKPGHDLIRRLDELNAWAERVESPGAAEPAALLFGPAPALMGRRRFIAQSAPEATHTAGLRTLSVVLSQAPTRLAFAQALGGFAARRGEDLLRVKGLIAFADRPDRIAVIHAVQHTIYRPDWLERWPDRDERSRLVFVSRDIAPEEIIARFAAFAPVPWTALPVEEAGASSSTLAAV
jgi:G3E family GTPase